MPLLLAIIIIPVVVRTTDNMLNLVPNNLREAAASLGCPQWRVITMICYRSARAGILTGVLLSIARISGETRRCSLLRYPINSLSFD
ncbi:phosphate transport system permease protein PstA, partial [Pasteurella multocida subsp. multocida str. Anand1_cattle]